MTEERVSLPLPENLGGFWLMQTVEWDEPDMGTSIVDLGWSHDGSKEDYRNVGYLKAMREAILALETLNDFLIGSRSNRLRSFQRIEMIPEIFLGKSE